MRAFIKMILILVFAIYMQGCGGSSNSSADNSKDNSLITNSTDESNGTINPSDDYTDDSITNSTNHTLSYQSGNGILIESLENGKKLVWVNSHSNFCKISRPSSRNSDVYNDGIDHCQMLSNQNYADISTWRLPTAQEASHLMKHVDRNKILYPDENPNCAIMATSTKDLFVRTTSPWNDPNIVGNSFTSSERNNKVAGIRCVSGK